MPQRIYGRFGPLKNITIVVLAALIVFQTGQLWFVRITNRNFFYTYFMSIVSPAAPDGHNDIVCPYRIISGSGDGRFDIYYSGLSGRSEKVYCDETLTAILKSGEYADTKPVDYETLLTRPMLLYEYAFPMTADIFVRAFGQKSNVLTARNVVELTGVAVQPPTETDETLHVFFINENQAAEFILSPNNRQEPSSKYAWEIPPAEGNIYYISAALEGMETVSPGLFIAQWDGSGPAYQSVTVTNPYANNYGEKLISSIQSRVEPLFDNPSAINAALGADGVYTFSSVNTVVRYYDRDVLEYASFRRVIDRNTAVNFMTDYSAAESFVKLDALVVNETYLADYSTDDDRNIFYFDYVINDMPLVLPTRWPSASENGHPIEVTVDHGEIVKYKKLVYNFHIDQSETLTGRTDFGQLTDMNLLDPTIIKILLGYRIENADRLRLSWFVENNDDGLIVGVGS